MTPNTSAYRTRDYDMATPASPGRREAAPAEDAPVVLPPEPRRIRDLPEWSDNEMGCAARLLLAGEGMETIALELGVGVEKARELADQIRSIGATAKPKPTPERRERSRAMTMQTVSDLRAAVADGCNTSEAARRVGVTIGQARWLLSRDW